MEVFTKLDNSVQDSAQGSALVGKAIGGLGALMYLGYMGWQMAAGDREWEITPMLKPILIGFTLVHLSTTLPTSWNPASDKQIVQSTMQQYKHRF